MLTSLYFLLVLFVSFSVDCFDNKKVKPRLLKKHETFKVRDQHRSNSMSIDGRKDFGEVFIQPRRAPKKYYATWNHDKLEDDFGYEPQDSRQNLQQRKASRV